MTALRRALASLFAAACTWLAPVDAAAAPAEIGYQGRLTDAAGHPLAGSVALGFALFADAEGGEALWSEAQPGVTVNEGVFHVALGSASPLPPSLFERDVLWLEVTVDGETLAPRQRLLSAPYARQADRAAKPPSLGELAGTACNVGRPLEGILEVFVEEPEGDIRLVCRPTRDFLLTVVKTGDGDGTVSSDPVGIDCGPVCSHPFRALTEIRLQATPAPGSQVVGSAQPIVRLEGDRVVEVQFALPPSLTVQTFGPLRPGPCTGACLPYTGIVQVWPPGAVCGSFGPLGKNATCYYEYPAGSIPNVTLTAVPQVDAQFTGWEGCPTPEGNVCRLPLQKGTLVRALFGPTPP